MNSISFTVEEENLICMYHHDDRRRTDVYKRQEME